MWVARVTCKWPASGQGYGGAGLDGRARQVQGAARAQAGAGGMRHGMRHGGRDEARRALGGVVCQASQRALYLFRSSSPGRNLPPGDTG